METIQRMRDWTREAAWDATRPSDEELAVVAAKDPAAFALLYKTYLDPIYRYCFRRLGNREEAEDATSIVFSRALTALPRYRSGSFRSWLFAISHNVIVDLHRTRRPQEVIDEDFEPITDDPSPEDIVIREEVRWDVRGLLARLPPDQQTVVELRLAGLTGPEICDVLGRSRAWVNTTQHRAVLRMREEMAGTSSARSVSFGKERSDAP